MSQHTRGARRRDPYRDVGRAQDLTREGVVATAELMKPELLRTIGDTLGGLNSIGALRSGGSTIALRDISRDFTNRIGQFASAATLGSIGQGLDATSMRNRRREARKQRQAALYQAIGGVIGAGAGFASNLGGGGVDNG